MSVKKRSEYVDIVRGIAMICIILGHLGIFQINRFVFTFHVPVFFFISGYFFKGNKCSLAEYAKEKGRTLLIPYGVTCLVIIVLAGLKALLLNRPDEMLHSMLSWCYASIYGAGDQYAEPFYIKAIGAIWFLWALFWGNIFMKLVLKCSIKWRAVSVLLVFFTGYFSRKLFWFPFSIQAGACATLFIYMGYLLKRSEEQLKKLPSELKIMGICIAGYGWIDFVRNFQSFWLVHCDLGRGLIDIAECVGACALLTLIAWSVQKYNMSFGKIFSFIGKNSILVLCLHIIELNLMPWDRMVQLFSLESSFGRIAAIIIGKMIFDIGGMYIMRKSWIVRKIYVLK